MTKVYAFNPPTGGYSNSRASNLGQGTYYAGLGMRKADVERRMRMHDQTGKDYLETLAAYNVEKNRSK